MKDITISTNNTKLDIDFIHQFLTNCYWSPGITREKVEIGINNSLCFGIYKSGKQIGFARVVTDFSRFAYLMDVFITENEKGNGYGKLLLKHILERQDLQVDKWLLGTRDAHLLYAKFGFTPIKEPARLMELKKQT